MSSAATSRACRKPEGLALNDFAVFYRTNAQSRVLEDGLRRSDIPYQIIGGLRFYDRQEIKDAPGLHAAVGQPARHAEPAPHHQCAAARHRQHRPGRALEALARDEGLSGFEVLERLVARRPSDAGLGKAALVRLKDFRDMLVDLMTKAAGMAAADIIQEMLEVSGYLAQLKAERTIEAETRLENLGRAGERRRRLRPAGGKRLVCRDFWNTRPWFPTRTAWTTTAARWC